MFPTRDDLLRRAHEMQKLADEYRAEAARVSAGGPTPGYKTRADAVASLLEDAHGYDTWRSRYERWAAAY